MFENVNKILMIQKITIEGYKSIKEQTVELFPINILIGGNGIGKSNFISAFTLIHNLYERNLQNYVLTKGGSDSLLYMGKKETDHLSFDLFFAERGKDAHNRFIVNMKEAQDSLFIERIDTAYHNGVSWHKQLHEVNKQESSFKNDHTGQAFYVNSFLREFEVYHFHDTGKGARVKQEHNISNNKMLLYDAANLAAFLYRLKNFFKQNYDEIVETIRLVAPYFDDFVLEPQEGNEEQIVLRWCQTGCEDIFNASQLSDGTLRFICLTTLLLQPHELQPATIIVDEPELGLHPYAITIFSEIVRQLSNEKQIIISTQSVELLNEFDVEDVIVVDRSDTGSEFRRLDPEQLKLWLDGDYTLGDLWKKNVLGGRLSK